PTHQGKLILDATVVEQAIRYPTDLSLLNEAREFSEKIIDHLHAHTPQDKKPRTYREKGRQAFLALVKQKRPGGRKLRRGIRQQLQYLRRNLGHIEQQLTHWPEGTELPLPRWLLYRYWVIQHLYAQQWDMYQTRTRRCDHRIVSISQPYVRPIIRGKQNKAVEFGAKLSVSLNGDGLARVDHLRWDAFHEGLDLKSQVEAFHHRTGRYPEKVLADPLYGTRANRSYLKQKGIHFAGKPLGRPKKVTAENRDELKQLKAQRRMDYLQRIPIEGKFGQGKSGYRLNNIRAKRADTSIAWVNSIFLVMNLLILERIFFVRCKLRLEKVIGLLNQVSKLVIAYVERNYPSFCKKLILTS
ncbi:MAG: transposase, partial [Methyloprofundus sp.]|nr:transposase [Methyloprofundus sp.]